LLERLYRSRHDCRTGSAVRCTVVVANHLGASSPGNAGANLMASVTLTMEGLAEFKAEVLRLPIELRSEAGNVVLSQARAAASAIAAGYPQKTGNLRSGVRTIKEAADQYSAISTVVSASPHVLLYERGTKPRAVRKPMVVKFKDGSYRTVQPNRGS